jgi:hypothetical protein
MNFVLRGGGRGIFYPRASWMRDGREVGVATGEGVAEGVRPGPKKDAGAGMGVP